MVYRIKIAIFVLFTAYFIQGCEKPREHPVPDVIVDIRLSLSLYTELQVPGGVKTEIGGVNGIIVYRIDPGSFGAYDRTCPYEVDNNCVVEIDGFYAICPCCSSKFLLENGGLVSGPAQWPLKTYKTLLSGNTLYIYN